MTEVEEILAQAEKFLGSVTIPTLKSIILDDLGMNEKFLNHNVGDRRKLLDWYSAAVKAFNQVKLIGEQNDNIN